MSTPEATTPTRSVGSSPREVDWLGFAVAVLVGAVGGTLGASLAAGSTGTYALLGALFGSFGFAALRGRRLDAGAGLIWGLGGGLFLWFLLASAGEASRLAGHASLSMIGDIRALIPELFACVLCIGAPVGVTLGMRAAAVRGRARFHVARAVAAGGSAGVASALIFSRWMYEGDFFPLIAGFGTVDSHVASVLLHIATACLIGCTFGVLFQNDVRNLGSSMGWGVAYAIFWWMLGPMTVFPAAYGQRPDWSAGHASELFGPLVGYIFYGLILGVVYSGANTVWTRLFVDSDPLNRKREGPGLHLLQSLGWGSAAGFLGGLIALPLMIQTGVITKLAGLEGDTPLALGVLLHLLASTAIGASYGILFRGEATDGMSCSLWGCVLGLIAWYAGPLTLMPLLRTGQCDWRPEAAAALLPILVSHLLFGLITANVFSAFERSRRRASPIVRYPSVEDAAAETDMRPTAPLGLFVLGMGLLLPILLG